MRDDFVLFDDVKYSDLIKDIYVNTRERKTKLELLVDKLNDMVSDTTSASIMVPLIKEYLEIGVKNDEHLVKLSGVLQRFVASMTKASSGDESLLTEEEKEQLLRNTQSELQELLDNSTQ